jgi:glycosyltransferase involved in cell wall biosynthesis
MKNASIIIATFNRANLLNRAINAMLKQKTSIKYEVIVVNDGSTDNTDEILEKFKKRKNFKLINLKKSCGPSVARNIGIAVAKHPIVIIMDDDCIPYQNWLTNLTKPFSDPSVGISTSYSMHGGTSTAYLKKTLDSVGLFDPKFSMRPLSFTYREDADLVFRVLDAGYRQIFVENAKFEHVHEAPKGFYRKIKYVIKRIWIKQADVLLYKKHPERTREILNIKFGFFIPPIIDFKRALGLWLSEQVRSSDINKFKKQYGPKMSISTPQGFVLIEAKNSLIVEVNFLIAIIYSLSLKFVRLIASIRYGKLLI